jgi:rhomboid family GlyGly-CTERM serine protease
MKDTLRISNRPFSTVRALPLAVVFGIAMISVVIPFFPDLAETLSWRRSAPSLVRLPTVITAHLTHWSLDHLVWDLVAFLALSAAAIALIPRRIVSCLLLSALAIPLEIALIRPEFNSYRGLSGLDSALFGLILAALWHGPDGARRLSILGLVAFFGKIGYELLTGDTLFVDRANDEFVPVVSAHVVGLVCGWLCGVMKPKFIHAKFMKPARNRLVLPFPKKQANLPPREGDLSSVADSL